MSKKENSLNRRFWAMATSDFLSKKLKKADPWRHFKMLFWLRQCCGFFL